MGLLCCLLSTFGCTAETSKTIDRVPVSGRVLIDGKPLAKGTIQVIPVGARMASGIIKDGHFSLMTYRQGDGTVLGVHAVAINGAEFLDEETMKWHTPEKYASPNASELTLDVQGETNSVLFELTWDGGKPFIKELHVDKNEGGDLGDQQPVENPAS